MLTAEETLPLIESDNTNGEKMQMSCWLCAKVIKAIKEQQ